MKLSDEGFERLRRSGIRLDGGGPFWHEGGVVRHHRRGSALRRWVDHAPNGGWGGGSGGGGVGGGGGGGKGGGRRGGLGWGAKGWVGVDPGVRIFVLAEGGALAQALAGWDVVVSLVGTRRARFTAGDTYESS